MKFKHNGLTEWMGRLMLIISLMVCITATNSWAFSISGTVSYGGSKTGRIYLSVYDQSNNPNGFGTSVSGAGTYTIRGVTAMTGGTYYVRAFMDTIGSGIPNIMDPLGATGPLTVSGLDLTVNIILSDPPSPTLPPSSPQEVFVTPGDSSALVMWEGPEDPVTGNEAAQTYNIYWSTNSDVMATFSGSITGIPARSDGHRIVTGLGNGDALYFAVSSLIGASESAAIISGPITIGTPAGGTTVSGTVTFPGTPPSGQLFVGISPPNSGPITYSIFPAPAYPQAFTVSGVPDGTYSVFAFIDANGNGRIDQGDPRSTHGNEPLILVSGSPLAGVIVPLNAANAAVSTATTHYNFNGNTNWYGLQFRAESNLKLPVKVTLNSGPGITGPLDLGIDQWGEYQYNTQSFVRPTLADSYNFTVSYPDSGIEMISSPVTGVLDSFATPLTPVGNTYGPTAAAPTFTWQAPTSPPPPPVYTYGLQFWPYWQVDSMPMTQFSAAYNFNGNASPQPIPLASSLSWAISLTDAKGNQSMNVASFTTPLNLDAQPGTAGGTYSYTPGAPGMLTLNWISASFICDGPALGTEIQSVTSITETTMTWVNGTDTMIWTRSPAGPPGNLLGTWNTTDPRSGNTFTITFNIDNTHTVTGNINQCQVTGGPVDTQPPTVPTGVTAMLLNPARIVVQWYNSTDNVGVMYYLVYRNGSPVAGVPTNSWQDTTVTAGTTYSYTVAACDSAGNCSAQSSPALATIPAIMNYGGVYHLTNNDDPVPIPVDILQMGIGKVGSSLGGVTATVSGPASFTYTFTDADIRPFLNGQFEVYKEFDSLAPGVYTFTLNDGNGNISNRVDTHATPLNLPIADCTKIQYLRKADGSHRFTWAPVNDTRTYYYRLRINRADGTHTPVYLPARKMGTIEDVPAGILVDGTAYEVRVQMFDAQDYSLVFNQSNSEYVTFTPQASDYNPNRLMFNYASANNVLGGNPTFSFRMATTAGTSTKTEAQLVTTPATLTGPAGFSDTISTANLVSPNGVDFVKSFGAATPGDYTLDVFANGIHHIANVTLTSPVLYPVPDATKYQAEDMGSFIRFSWADADYTGALYYRLYVQDTATTKVENFFSSARLNQTSIDIAKTSLGTLANRQWRAEIYDSLLADTQRNRVNGNFVTLAGLPAYDPGKPAVSQFRFCSLNRPNGPATEIAVTAADPDGTLSAVYVAGPNTYSRNLLAQGQLSGNTYSLIEAGAPAAGLYALTVTDKSAKTVTRLNQQPTPHTVPLVDYHTFQVGLDGRYSWAPVVTDVPLWYTLEIVSTNTMATMATVSNVQSASVLGSMFFQEPTMFRVRANDGSNDTTTNNSSQSVFVGYQPGLNYATLTDNDNDGYASNIDTNDNDPLINPSVPGSIVFSPPSVNFGNFGLGSSSTQTVIITNTGGGSISITSANQTGDTADLSVSSGGVNPCPALPVIMPAGYSCTLVASFNPVATGVKTFTMSLVSNAANNPVAITLTGNALPATITTVNPASGSSNPSYLADPVTFTAVVSPPTATGTVQFRIDGLDYGVPAPLVGGTATSVPVANLTVGPHSISAVYSGDSSLGGSTAVGFTQTVNDKVMIGSSGNFLTMQAAIDAALNTNILLLRDTHFAEDLIIKNTPFRTAPFTITLHGGLASDFTTLVGTTIVRSLKIQQGTVKGNRLTIRRGI